MGIMEISFESCIESSLKMWGGGRVGLVVLFILISIKLGYFYVLLCDLFGGVRI